jgi:hypothetical protein
VHLQITPGRGGGARRRLARVIGVVAGALGLVLLGTLASAFWSGGGAGAASAGVGLLSPPTSVTASATPGTTTVAVAWTGTSAPGGGAVTGYYVQRYLGATASPACSSSPTALLGPAVTTCSDGSVPYGSYTYTVTAVFRSWTATSAPSAPVAVTSVASFTVSAPASTTAGTAFSVTVTAKDQSNATITGYTGTVHFTTTDPAGVVPADYTFVAADHGTHTFSNAVTMRTAPTQSITVNDTAAPSAKGSASVNVAASAATQLAFTQQPGGGTAGTAWATQPTVTVEDAFGNAVTSSSASVTLAITAGSGNPSGTLTCTANPKAAAAGAAGFAGCSIDMAASGYTLTASSSGLASAVSTAFTVNPGAAAQLVFTQQPGGGMHGPPWASQPTVTVEDAFGNVVTSSSASVTLAITAGTGNPSGKLICNVNPLAATSGVAAFAGCKINKAGSDYTLTATSAGLASAVSAAFTVT